MSNITHKIYYINLDRRPDRRAYTEKQFALQGIEATRFTAIDGNDLSPNGHINPYEIGCATSHLEIIKSAREEDLEYVIIFEDDVVLCENFQAKLNSFMQDLPYDWDMMYFGGHFHAVPAPAFYQVKNNACRIRGIYCTLAYAIRKTIYDRAIDKISLMRKPIDNYFAEDIIPISKAYCHMPFLAGKVAGYSDVSSAEYPQWDVVNKWFKP